MSTTIEPTQPATGATPRRKPHTAAVHAGERAPQPASRWRIRKVRYLHPELPHSAKYYSPSPARRGGAAPQSGGGEVRTVKECG